jgi:hypothetical protein
LILRIPVPRVILQKVTFSLEVPTQKQRLCCCNLPEFPWCERGM